MVQRLFRGQRWNIWTPAAASCCGSWSNLIKRNNIESTGITVSNRRGGAHCGDELTEKWPQISCFSVHTVDKISFRILGRLTTCHCIHHCIHIAFLFTGCYCIHHCFHITSTFQFSFLIKLLPKFPLGICTPVTADSWKSSKCMMNPDAFHWVCGTLWLMFRSHRSCTFGALSTATTWTRGFLGSFGVLGFWLARWHA